MKSEALEVENSGMPADHKSVMYLNFLLDYYDLIHLYESESPEGQERKKRSLRPKPSCSVIIKHMKEDGDIFMGHNTWHEYRAMGYRSMHCPHFFFTDRRSNPVPIDPRANHLHLSKCTTLLKMTYIALFGYFSEHIVTFQPVKLLTWS